MRLSPILVFLALLVGCSPTYNWRDVRVDGTPLTALLPCKPDSGQRLVPMLGREVALNMVGCDAGGATFAVAWAQVGQPDAVAALAQWQQAMLRTMRAGPVSRAPFAVQRASAQPAPELLSAQGQHPGGGAVQAQALWFARDGQIFQAVVYAPNIAPEMVDSFFSGLRLQ